MSTLAERLALLFAENPSFTKADLARACGIKPPSVSDWFNGKTKQLVGTNLNNAAGYLGVTPDWLASGKLPMRPSQDAKPSRYRIADAGEGDDEASEIMFIDAKGSCGGGVINWEADERPPLVKESSWFRRYKVRPRDAIAVWAYGDSMADYIVDGDIVIFNTAKIEPKSGEIFLIDHPDGLRIKRMRRSIDGSWILESLNPDKRRYPDETIQPDQAELLRIKGQFVYRQGG